MVSVRDCFANSLSPACRGNSFFFQGNILTALEMAFKKACSGTSDPPFSAQSQPKKTTLNHHSQTLILAGRKPFLICMFLFLPLLEQWYENLSVAFPETSAFISKKALNFFELFGNISLSCLFFD